jgi:hypothetical protein
LAAIEGYDPVGHVAEEVEFGLRELDPSEGHIVALEYWHVPALRQSSMCDDGLATVAGLTRGQAGR